MIDFWPIFKSVAGSTKLAAVLCFGTLLLPVQVSAQIAPDSSVTSNGRQPFTLRANRNEIIPEQDFRLKTTVTVPSLAPGVPRLDYTQNGSIDSNTFQLDAKMNSLGAVQQPQAILQGRTRTNMRILSDYDVELIVDSSLSMRRMDCPGGLSRWNWCGVQAEDLGRQLNPYVPRGLTITAFASNYYVYRNATPSNIADLFNNPNFRGGTRLAEPLDNRLNEFFANRKSGSKPLLIAVITDGVPHPQEEPVMVANALLNASKRMKDAQEVTVVFFQIGGRAKFGREFLDFLDNGLVKNGARFDFVRTVSFDRLVQVGLAQALVESIEQFAKNRAQRTSK